jgi:hypothetical protein
MTKKEVNMKTPTLCTKPTTLGPFLTLMLSSVSRRARAAEENSYTPSGVGQVLATAATYDREEVNMKRRTSNSEMKDSPYDQLTACPGTRAPMRSRELTKKYMASWGRLVRRGLIGALTTLLLALVFLTQGNAKAFADSITIRDSRLEKAHSNYDIGAIDGPQLVKACETIWTDYYKEHPPRTFAFGVGQALFDSQFPVASFVPGTMGELTFEFINTDTLQQQMGGPTIGSVLYELNLDPDGAPVYVPIGASADAASNFALPFTLPGGATWVHAIPYDTSGNPIVFTDIDGVGNVAVGDFINVQPAPEPSSLLLVGWGVLGLAGILRKRMIT